MVHALFNHDSWHHLKNFIGDAPVGLDKVGSAIRGISSKQHNTIQRLLKKSGVPIDNIQKGLQHGGFWDIFKKLLGTDDFQTGVVAPAVGAAASYVNLNTGGALAGVVTVVKEVADWYKGGHGPEGLTRGTWVHIDNGEEKLVKKTELALDYGAIAMFGEAPLPRDIEETAQHIVSLGFIVEPTVEEDSVSVFNFETGEIQTKRRQDVKPIGESEAKALDDKPNIKAIKLMVLEKKQVAEKLKCDIPCDPGQEVVYQNVRYKVVECDGTNITIENEEQAVKVPMREVTRGRVEHTNTWNYGATEGFESGVSTSFHKGVTADYYKGQWCWTPCRESTNEHSGSRSERELGVLRLINGELLDGYYAFDGARFNLPTRFVKPCNRELAATFDLHREFKIFKAYAAEGHASVRSSSLGLRFVDEITAGVEFNHVLSRPQVDAAGNWVMVEEGHVVDGKVEALVGSVKGAVDAATPGGATPGETVATKVETAGELHIPTRGGEAAPEILLTGETGPASSSSSALMIGGVVVVGLIGLYLFRGD